MARDIIYDTSTAVPLTSVGGIKVAKASIPVSYTHLDVYKRQLVTGPTGSGKSTTLASMIEYINQTKSTHIITIEDPIEYTLSLIHI